MDKAKEYAESKIGPIANSLLNLGASVFENEIQIINDELAAAFRAGEAYGHANAGRIEHKGEP